MRILGIETSCDETAASIVEDGRTVLSNIIATATADVAPYGGVFPEVAARRQVEYIVPVIERALKSAGTACQDIKAIAVTKGPGLLTSLLVGVMAARTLASAWKQPLIGVHHTLGHLDSPWLELENTLRGEAYQYTSILVPSAPPEFPTLTLSVSGGHTELWLRGSHTRGTLLGRTLDDAAGEAFDKGAVLLGLPYPGGPALSRLAGTGNPTSVTFPSPLAGEETCNFSFAGLKTSLKYHLRDRGGLAVLSQEEIRDITASYQEAICRHLVSRVERAIRLHPHVHAIHLVGGVSANARLQTLLQDRVRQLSTACPAKLKRSAERSGVNGLPTDLSPEALAKEEALAKVGQLSIRWPAAIEFCTDNAAMIAGAAFFMVQELSEKAFAPFETEASPQLIAF